MGSDESRLYFASERTLLAWVRTGLAVMGLGFVVARFDLFLRLTFPHADGSAALVGSDVVGVGLVVVGTLCMAVSAWQHARFTRTIDERPHPYWFGWSVLFAALLTISGVFLTAYLTIWSFSPPTAAAAASAPAGSPGPAIRAIGGP